MRVLEHSTNQLIDTTIKELGVTHNLANCDLVRVDVDDTHHYFIYPENSVSGIYCVSVTHVLDIAGPFPEGLRNYLRMATFEEQKERLEMTGDRGKKLHNALDLLMKGAELNLDDYPTTYEKEAILTFKRCMRFLAPTKWETELPVADIDLKVAGTLDWAGVVEKWKLEMLLDPNKYLELDNEGDYMVKERWLDMPDSKKTKVVVDYKFTGRNAYSHKVQVAKYKHMYNKSYAGRKVSAAYTWRYSPRHKFGFDFQYSDVSHQAFKRIYDTYLEYMGGFPEPPLLKIYPKTVKLFEEIKLEEK